MFSHVTNRFHSFSIQRKLITIIILTCAIALLMSSVINILFQWNLLTVQAVKRLEIIAEGIALQSRAPLEFMDPKAAKENLRSLRPDPDVEIACLYDDQRNPVAIYTSAALKANEQGNCIF